MAEFHVSCVERGMSKRSMPLQLCWRVANLMKARPLPLKIVGVIDRFEWVGVNERSSVLGIKSVKSSQMGETRSTPSVSPFTATATAISILVYSIMQRQACSKMDARLAYW